MLIWSGWGWLVVVILILSFGAIVVGADAVGAKGVMDAYLWPGAMAIAAIGTFILSTILNRREERVLIDPKTNEQVVLKHGDSLFFIPVRFWVWIFLAFGGFVFVQDHIWPK